MRLLLGPIIGHTDSVSTRIWVRADAPVERLRLRLDTGAVPRVLTFESTEWPSSPSQRVFGTGICTIDKLVPGRTYQFRVVDAAVPLQTLGEGRFRTLAPSDSLSSSTVVSTSCSGGTRVPASDNAWPNLHRFVRRVEPDVLVLTGDQVYTDAGDCPWDLWKDLLRANRKERLRAFVEVYQRSWERLPIRETMSRIPTAMMWDDHEIRDGWGSRPGDTGALLLKYPAGQRIVDLFNAYFMDAREANWHFQRCHGPIGPFLAGLAFPGFANSPNFGLWRPGAPIVSMPAMGRQATTPYWFDVGSTRIVMFDGRGARDFFREPKQPGDIVNRVLGDAQWQFVGQMLQALPPTVRAVIAATGVPIVDASPDGLPQRVLGSYDGDVKAFKRGDLRALLATFGNDKNVSGADMFWSAATNLVEPLPALVGRQPLEFFREPVDDLRDSWAHARNVDECGRLIRTFGSLTLRGRPHEPLPAGFLGGDIHVGGIMQMKLGNGRQIECAIGSAIAKTPPSAAASAVLLEREFHVPKVPSNQSESVLQQMRFLNPAIGESILEPIAVKLDGELIRKNNFAITRIDPSGASATITNAIEFEGRSDVLRVKANIRSAVASINVSTM